MSLSLRSRLTIGFTALSGAILILSMIILYVQVSKSLEKDFLMEMDHDAILIAEIFKEEMRLNAFNEFREEISEFGIELQVEDETGNVMLESEGWEHSSANSHLFAQNIKNVTIDNFGTFTIHILRSKEALLKIKLKLKLWIWGIIPFMMVLCWVAGYYFSGRALRPMETAFEKLRRFTADASHELRIPLTALRGTVEVALRRDRPKEEYIQALENALEEAEHLSRLTGDLLMLARSDAGQPVLQIEQFNLEKFFTEIFSLAQGLNNKNKVNLDLINKANGQMKADPERLRQLLLNLIDNAIKYSKPNDTVILRSEITGNQLMVTLEDQGIGIPPHHQKRIFDRFYRVDKSRSRSEGGTGLGLSIVQWIVEAHHGTIDITSEENQGTTITVKLPTSV